MGVVYQARHSENGQEVALKTVTVPHQSLVAGIRREIHALARLHHPGIVRIVDEGVAEGVPWYAMELLRGMNLRRHVAAMVALPSSDADEGSAATTPLQPSDPDVTRKVEASAPAQPPRPGASALRVPSIRSLGPRLPDALTLVRRLCAPLAFLHGEGIVHRDLKPDNVLVSDGGLPVLVDFGLMSQFSRELSREILGEGGEMVGTVWYMAPEQCRGELVDARADLYALGCILYELVTGRPPFVAAEPIGVVYQHLSSPPTPPSELVTGLPDDVDKLILTLLSKDPRRRPGYAADIDGALRTMGARNGRSGAAPAARVYLYRPGLAGRQDVLARLCERLDSLAIGVGTVALVTGESGVGKTRLALALEREARARAVNVLAGDAATPGATVAPLGPLRAPLRGVADHCRERGPAETARVLGPRAPLLSRYEPSIASLLEVAALPEPPELPAEAARLRLFSYLTETFRALATTEPLLLMVDDLQWADDLTVGFLSHLEERIAEGALPIMVVGAQREEEARPDVSEIGRRPGVVAVSLGRLDETQVASIVADMLAYDPPPASFVALLARLSEGNPFFVAEYLRAAVAEGLVHRDGRGDWQVGAVLAGDTTGARLALPHSIRELVGRRLAGLGPGARRTCEVAAVLGRQPDEDLLVAVSGLSDNEAMEGVGELIARQVMEQPPLRFAHDRIREVAYAAIDDTRRRELHRDVAMAIERRPGADDGADLAARAHHWQMAGDKHRARPLYLAAARHAAGAYAHEEAERLYRTYLELATPPDSIAARNELGERILCVRGRLDDALAQHDAALAEARQCGDGPAEIASLLARGRVHRMAGRMEQSQVAYESAHRLAVTRRDETAQAHALGSLGNVLSDLGRIEEARDHYDRALAIARAAGDRPFEGTVLRNLGVLELETGRPRPALSSLEASLAIVRDSGDRRGEGIVLVNLATLQLSLGRHDESHRLHTAALAIAREVGDRRAEGAELVNIGNIHFGRRELDRAAELYEQALTILRESGNLHGQGVTLGNLANIHHDRGRHAEARGLFERARNIHHQLGNRRAEGHVIANLASLEADLGHLDAARLLNEASLALLTSVDDRRSCGEVIVHLARLGRRSGQEPAARRRLLAHGRQLLERSGAREELAECLCELGLAADLGDATDFLDRATTIAEALATPPDGELARMLLELRRHVEELSRRP